MSKTLAILIILLVIIGGVWYVSGGQKQLKKENQQVQTKEIKNVKPMQILSPAFKNSEEILSKYTCEGENINFPLQISDVPEGTKTLAIIVDDPDAPMDPSAGGWVHWVLWNIDPATSFIAENSVPKGAVVGRNDFGMNNYGGPCPPSGSHRYFIKLYAVDSKLNLSSFSGKAELVEALKGHQLAEAEYFGIYQKRK